MTKERLYEQLKTVSKTDGFRYSVSSVFVMALALCSAFGKFHPVFALVVALAEALTLLVLPLVRRDLVLYYILFIVFAGTALSHPTFIYNDANKPLYTFVQLPFVYGTHVPVLLMLPLLFVFLKKGFSLRAILSDHKALRNTLRFVFLMLLSGFLFGFVVRWCNDNGLGGNYDLWYYLIERHMLLYFNLLLLMVGLSYCFLSSPALVDRFENYLLVYMFGIAAATIFSVLFGWSADYMDNTTLLLSQVAIFNVFLLVYPLYSKKQRPVKILSLVLGGASTLAMLFKSSELAGKWWIYVAAVLAVALFKMFTSKKRALIITASVIVVGAAGFVVFFLNFSMGLGLAETKMHQFLKMLNVFAPHWYENLPDSPKVRLDELVNVVLEYVHKPFYAVFGKGYSATVLKRWGATDWGMPNAFTPLEQSSGVFGLMHETVNCTILGFGLFGVVFLLREVWFFIRRFKDSFPCLVGFMWFIFFYTTTYSALYIGLCCFLYAKVVNNDPVVLPSRAGTPSDGEKTDERSFDGTILPIEPGSYNAE